MGVGSNSSLGNKGHHQTLRLGQLPSSQGWERQPHDPLPSQWAAPPLYLYVARIKVWGLHIKQTGPFDVDGNTNTDLSRVVTAYLFPLVIHWAACWMCMSSKGCCMHQWYSSRGGCESALASWVVGRPSGFLFLRFDIDLLAVHGKIRGTPAARSSPLHPHRQWASWSSTSWLKS